MTSITKPSDLTYPQIKIEVEKFRKQYINNNSLPGLPTEKELTPFYEFIKRDFNPLSYEIKKHFNTVGADKNNGFDHAIWVAVRAAYIANKECRKKGLKQKTTRTIIKRSILAGLLHDIDRHLGFGKEHMIQGEKTARKILSEYNLNNEDKEDVVKTIRYHDDVNYDPEGFDEFKIVFGSVFDADHLRYGLEREGDFWDKEQRRGTKPTEVIHDYKWLYSLKGAWKTEYGKNVGKKLIDYAIAISEHIEMTFKQ